MSHTIRRPRPACFAALLLALALPLTGCVGDSTGPHDFLAEEDFSFAFDATAKVLLTMEAQNGTITITGVAGGDQLNVDGVRQVWATSQADADEHLDSLEVTIDENPDNFVITTEQPSSGQRTYVVNYDIELPDGMELVIASGNGDITITAMDGDIVIASGNGDVTLEDIEASVVVALGNGNIDAEVTLPLGGNLEAAVGNGTIALAIPQSTSAEFSAEVGNGSITVVNLTLQDQVVTPTTVTGTLGGGEGTIGLAAGNGNITATGI
jgi:hypothetical protein